MASANLGRLSLLLIAGFGLAGTASCADEPAEDEDSLEAFDTPLTEAEEDAVLDLVNEASLELLDDDVGLDKRAAENIVEHRQGPDAQDGTADDDLFDDIDELDAIPYVGPSALDKLVAYVHAQGLVAAGPTDDDALILNLANTASLSELDDDVGLDKRAAENIVEHRQGPDGQDGTADDDRFDDIEELDAIPYVGPAALELMLAYAKANLPVPTGEACLIISEYIEGQGMNNKAIELYNCGDAPLALEEFGVCLVRNESSTCSVTSKLPAGTLAPGAVLTTCRTAQGTFQDPMQFIQDRCQVELGTTLTFNGDDRVAVFRDNDADGSFGAGDTITDMLGRFGYQPPVTTWQDVTLRRCNFTPSDGESFYDHEDYFFEQSWGNQGDYGVPPTETCGPDGGDITAAFVADFQAALVPYYDQYGADIAASGGNDLATAQSLVSAANVTAVTDQDDMPLGYDLGTYDAVSHPDVVFPGSGTVWFGFYEADGTLVEVAPFN